tara:strand:- start:105 stop:557 length:453 start_codon:yes stop_codon:yes gene_type:complete
MPTSDSNVWRDLLEIRQVLKEVAIRHNIHDEDDDAQVILDELKNQDDTEIGPEPESLLRLAKEEIRQNQNIFERIDVEEIQKIVTQALMKESMANKEPEQTVEVVLELEQDLFMSLAIEAHKRNMKFNDLVIEILKEYMDKNLTEEEQTT